MDAFSSIQSKTPFLRVIFDLELSLTENHSGWERFVYYSFAAQNESFDKVPFTLGQTLELGIINEISLCTQIAAENLEYLVYPSKGPIITLQNMTQQVNALTPIQQLNLSYALTSLARYFNALEVFKKINYQALNPQAQLYYHLLSITLSQTHEIDFIDMSKVIDQIKQIVEFANIDKNNIIIAAGAVIVNFAKYFLKDKNIIKWFIDHAEKQILKISQSRESKDLTILSGYYRAFSMLPANDKDKKATRAAMIKAYEYADAILPKSPLEEAVKDYCLRSYYQSTVKEYLYLYRDFSQAEKYSEILINHDKNWSISYIEAAECYLKNNNFKKALQFYLKARKLGLPRLIYSTYMVAFCYEQLGEVENALNEYRNTMILDPGNVSAAVNGFILARQRKHPAIDFFNNFIETWDKEGILPEAAKNILNRD